MVSGATPMSCNFKPPFFSTFSNTLGSSFILTIMPPKKESLAKRKAAAIQAPNKRVKSESFALKPNEQNISVDNGTTKSVMNLHGIPVLPDTVHITSHLHWQMFRFSSTLRQH